METSNILLLSNDNKVYEIINTYMNSLNISVHKISSSNLMHTVYKYRAQLLIVDLDEYQQSVIEIVKSIQAYDYIPVVYTYSLNYIEKIDKSIENEVTIPKERLRISLSEIIKQSILFKKKYEKTTQFYGAMDSITSLTDKVLNTYIDSNLFDYTNFIKEILKKILTNETILPNKPSFIMITNSKINENTTEIYTYSNGEVTMYCSPISLEGNKKLYKNVELEREFFYNFDKEELADVENQYNVLDERILDILPKTNNISGYATTNTTIIGINYEKTLSSFDADIIKALCIELNLINNIYTKIEEAKDAFIYTVNALARAAEANDDDTGYHIKRVNEYSRLIAEELGLDDEFIKTIYFSAQMHDVGKIHIPKNIISKPGRLTDKEFDLIKRHTVYGARIIGNSEQLEMAKEIALNHHERFDGTGYPHGKKAEEIPLSARIVMLADIYDALRSPRSYKPSFTHERACQIILEGDGRVMSSHFDPKIQNIFKRVHNKFNEIYNKYNDIDKVNGVL